MIFTKYIKAMLRGETQTPGCNCSCENVKAAPKMTPNFGDGKKGLFNCCMTMQETSPFIELHP